MIINPKLYHEQLKHSFVDITSKTKCLFLWLFNKKIGLFQFWIFKTTSNYLFCIFITLLKTPYIKLLIYF